MSPGESTEPSGSEEVACHELKLPPYRVAAVSWPLFP